MMSCCSGDENGGGHHHLPGYTGIQYNTLLSASTFAKAGYVRVLTPDVDVIYNKGKYHAIETNAVLRGQRDPPTILWRAPP